MRTLIGSVNLILVAPLTALIASWLLCGAKLSIPLGTHKETYDASLEIEERSTF
jgi:hypothetical protein